ncbi:hypothetical protein ACJVC5_13700 [Peredibacter sp. HCB2-198]|uniref:hypothetical protein n=1 Tax=Peredibacter sp. HCB2-198 TaxID=3383025 RepID=UPI0038B6AF34
MKKLALSLSLLLVSAAHASVILESPTVSGSYKREAVFEINRAEGTAWVNLKQYVRHHRGRGETYDQVTEHKAQVEGLSFDANTSTIVLDQDGALHECATVVRRGISIFKYDKITPTGCKLSVERESINWRRSKLKVHLIAE